MKLQITITVTMPEDGAAPGVIVESNLPKTEDKAEKVTAINSPDKEYVKEERVKRVYHFNDRVCEICGTTYTPKASNQRFCSKPCKHIGNYADAKKKKVQQEEPKKKVAKRPKTTKVPELNNMPKFIPQVNLSSNVSKDPFYQAALRKSAKKDKAYRKYISPRNEDFSSA